MLAALYFIDKVHRTLPMGSRCVKKYLCRGSLYKFGE